MCRSHKTFKIIAIIFTLDYCQSSDLSLVPFTSLYPQATTHGDGMNVANWRLKLLDFPRPALYDSGLTNSLQVSVHVSQEQSYSSAMFSFKPPTMISCSKLSYLLILTTSNYSFPRLEGPFKSSDCHAKLKIPVFHIASDAEYSAYVVAYNSSLSFRSMPVKFTTTDVTWATVVQGPSHIMITCHFTKASEAKGCQVQIKLASSFATESKKTIQITRHPSSHSASHCWKVPANVYPQDVEVTDWKIDGRSGSLAVSTYTEEKPWSPCVEDLDSRWHRAEHLVLFCMAAMFMVGGIALQCSGILCRMAGLDRYLKRRGDRKQDKRRESYSDYQPHQMTEKVNIAIQIDNAN